MTQITADAQISLLWARLVDFVISTGAERLDTLDAPWTATLGDWDMTLNAKKVEVDDIPPLHFRLAHRTALVGLALVGPRGGCGFGTTEDALLSIVEAGIASNQASGLADGAA